MIRLKALLQMADAAVYHHRYEISVLKKESVKAEQFKFSFPYHAICCLMVWYNGKHLPESTHMLTSYPPENILKLYQTGHLLYPEYLIIWCVFRLLTLSERFSEPFHETLRTRFGIPIEFDKKLNKFLKSKEYTFKIEKDNIDLNSPFAYGILHLIAGTAKDIPSPDLSVYLEEALNPYEYSFFYKSFLFWAEILLFLYRHKMLMESESVCRGFVKITPASHPEIHELVQTLKETLNLKTVPDIYINTADKTMNAFTVGMDSPSIVLTQSLCRNLTKNELRFVIGHELGHIISGHLRYHYLGFFLRARQMQKHLFGDILMSWIFSPTLITLENWMKTSELYADRIGFACSGDYDAAVHALMKVNKCHPHCTYCLRPDEFPSAQFAEECPVKCSLNHTHIHPSLHQRIQSLKSFSELGVLN